MKQLLVDFNKDLHFENSISIEAGSDHRQPFVRPCSTLYLRMHDLDGTSFYKSWIPRYQGDHFAQDFLLMRIRDIAYDTEG